MAEKAVYLYSNYKTFLRDVFLAPENRGMMSAAAEHLRCGKAFLSRVLNEKMDISTDQGFHLAQYLKLNKEESEFFILLIEISRATTETYKKHLQKKASTLKAEFEIQQRRGESPLNAFANSELSYFSDWYVIPLHLATSFEKGISSDEAVRLFRLPLRVVEKTFQFLLALGYISEKKDRFFFLKGGVHLSPDDPMVSLLHRNLRERAVQDLQMHAENSLHLSYWFALSEKDLKKLREMIQDFIQSVNHLVDPSASERVIGFSLDLTTLE